MGDIIARGLAIKANTDINTINQDITQIQSDLQGVVLGQIPDGTITDVKLSDEEGQVKDRITKLEDGASETKGALQEVNLELINHKADTMPHLVRDITNNKTYRYGYQIQDGVTQLIFEEVV
jgi:hypothetical protein